MRLMPRSLFGRLLGTAIVALLVALAFAAVTIGHVLERFVMHGLDERLDAQIVLVARAVRPDGRLDRARLIDLPPFDTPGGDWAWEVKAPRGTARSVSLQGTDIAVPDAPSLPFLRNDPGDTRPRPFDIDGRGRDGAHGRVLAVPTRAGAARIVATGPRSVASRPLHAAMRPLLLSLVLLGVSLATAILIQLRFGLRPLATLRTMVGEVRAGTRGHVDATEPTELLPLIAELNALIDANRVALDQARGHVANLAHGLKTPLAALRLDLAAAGRDPDGRLAAHVERIDRHVRHHLGRARAASPAGAGRIATGLRRHVADIVDALTHIHAERPVRATIAIPTALAVRCDPQDVDEVLGNLLDNGWRWATSSLAVSAERAGAMIRIAIADDGPGIAEAALGLVLQPGARLDERGDGHGFGLSIAREIVELYGGALMLENAAGGGLTATITLPAA